MSKIKRQKKKSMSYLASKKERKKDELKQTEKERKKERKKDGLKLTEKERKKERKKKNRELKNPGVKK